MFISIPKKQPKIVFNSFISLFVVFFSEETKPSIYMYILTFAGCNFNKIVYSRELFCGSWEGLKQKIIVNE